MAYSHGAASAPCEGAVRIIAAFFLSITFLPVLSAQSPDDQPIIHTDVNNTPQASGEARDRMMRDMAKKANLQRAAALKSDTEKLLKLATELKAYVDKTDDNVMSLEVIRKAAEIEKLAHSVKDKMKGPN